MDIVAQTLACTKIPAGCSTSLSSSPIFQTKSSMLAQPPKIFITQLQSLRIQPRNQRTLVVVNASETESTSSSVKERWLLEPAGDGDSRHIGYKVEMPNAFEIASSEVIVGRLPEKANVVIPVATVSALHARIQKKEGNLLVTDLDSTNGTYIGEKRLRPGVAVAAPPGSYVTFGDIHLALFRVSKLEKEAAPSKAAESESEDKEEIDNPTEGNEATS